MNTNINSLHIIITTYNLNSIIVFEDFYAYKLNRNYIKNDLDSNLYTLFEYLYDMKIKFEEILLNYLDNSNNNSIDPYSVKPQEYSIRDREVNNNEYAYISDTKVEFPILCVQENSRNILIYTKSKSYCVQQLLFINELKFGENSSSVQIKTDLYITGGYNEKNNFGQHLFYKYEFLLNRLHVLPDMINPHYSHTTISFQDAFILTLTGFQTKKFEYFDINNNTWYSLPDINIWRIDATAFIYNNSYVYLFGGWNNLYKKDEFYVDRIERYLLKFENNNYRRLANNKWDYVNIVTKNHTIMNPRHYLKKVNMGIIKLKDNKLLILGGENYDENKKMKFLNIPIKESILEVKIDILGGLELVKVEKLTKGCSFKNKKEFLSYPTSIFVDTFGNFTQEGEYCKIEIENDKIKLSFID